MLVSSASSETRCMLPQGRTSHRVLLLVVPVVAVGGVAACSGSAGSPPGASATTQGPTSPVSAGSSASASTPAQPAKTVAPVPVESNPPGDIPDNLAFIRYANGAGGYSFTHPEGWARTGSGTRVRFTDKLNGVTVESLAATGAPTPSSARADDVPRLQGSLPAFQLRSVSAVRLPAG